VCILFPHEATSSSCVAVALTSSPALPHPLKEAMVMNVKRQVIVVTVTQQQSNLSAYQHTVTINIILH
jgi:hypothetical protein